MCITDFTTLVPINLHISHYEALVLVTLCPRILVKVPLVCLKCSDLLLNLCSNVFCLRSTVLQCEVWPNLPMNAAERERGRRHLRLTLCCTEHWRQVYALNTRLHYPLYCIVLQIAEVVVVAVRKVLGSSELVGNGGGGVGGWVLQILNQRVFEFSPR